jgi:hypothetical protein
MWISGISVEIKHPAETIGEEVKGGSDVPQAFFPNDWQKWAEQLNDSVRNYRKFYMEFSSTSMPEVIAIAFRHTEGKDGESGFQSLQEGEAFGFIVDMETLKELHAAVGAAIAAARK